MCVCLAIFVHVKVRCYQGSVNEGMFLFAFVLIKKIQICISRLKNFPCRGRARQAGSGQGWSAQGEEPS